MTLALPLVDAKVCSSGVRAKMGDRVLDLCCGSGDLAFLLSQKVGLDGEVGVGFTVAFGLQTSQPFSPSLKVSFFF